MQRTFFRTVLTGFCIAFLFSVLYSVDKPKVNNELKIYDSTVTWKHYGVLRNDYSVKSFGGDINETVFPVKIIENKYLKVTLLPDFGGRILSIFYKPTGHEELYQNPVGTPFGMNQGNFYYDYLMVYGGIFPTFPEPEHGKTWNMKWDSRLVSESPDQISFEMSMVDDKSAALTKAPKFGYGKTELTCITLVTIYKERNYVEFSIRLTNNKPLPVTYEYWTCTTLAPGSVSGDTKSPGNTEIVAPVYGVKLKSDWWGWMTQGNSGKSIDGCYELNKLSIFSNWTDMGIAYAYPKLHNGWYGVINHENEEGILRISDNSNKTPGMKLWTWGYEKSIRANISNSAHVSRPYIELWSGHSTEFFKPVSIKGNEEKNWVEYYYPTVGLSKISYANQYGAIQVDIRENTEKKSFEIKAGVFSTLPDLPLTITILAGGKDKSKIFGTSFKSDPAKASWFVSSISKDKILDKESNIVMLVSKKSGEELIKMDIPLIGKQR